MISHLECSTGKSSFLIHVFLKKCRFSVGSTVWRIFANEEVITELWEKKTIVCSLQQVHLEAPVNTDLT